MDIEITLLRMKLNIHSIHLCFILEFQLIRTRGICAQHLDNPILKIDRKCPKRSFWGAKQGSDCVNYSRILSWLLLGPEFNPNWYQLLQIIISQGLQIVVPELGEYILELFIDGEGWEAVHFYNNVDEIWFIKTFFKHSQGKSPVLLAG